MEYKSIGLFIAGVAVGAGVTYLAPKVSSYFKALKAKKKGNVTEKRISFEEMAIDAMNNYFEKPKEENKVEREAYERMVSMYDKSETIGPTEDDRLIYEISAEEFSMNIHGDQISLKYWEVDDVLSDDADEPFDRSVINGDQFIKSLIDNEKGWVYIRDDRSAVDYEIELIHASYAEETGDFIVYEDDEDVY